MNRPLPMVAGGVNRISRTLISNIAMYYVSNKSADAAKRSAEIAGDTSRIASEALEETRTQTKALMLSVAPRLLFDPPPWNRPKFTEITESHGHTMVWPTPGVPTMMGYSWKIGYQNGGHGTATNIRPYFMMETTSAKGPYPERLNWAWGIRQPSVYPPLGPGKAAIFETNGMLPSEAVVQVENGSQVLTVELRLEYWDETSWHCYQTSICVTYIHATGLTWCKAGNYTGECNTPPDFLMAPTPAR